MELKAMKVPFDVLNHLPPVALIDSSGMILWSNPAENNVPIGSIGRNILDTIPELVLEELMHEGAGTYVTINGLSYHVSSYPLEKNRETTLFFELIETRTLNSLFESPYEGFIFVDKNGIIRMINETLAHHLKVSKSRLVGQHFDKFKVDPSLHRIIETQKPDLLTVFSAQRNIIASRHPVFQDGEFIGVYGRYFSIDSRDLKENTYGDEYADLLEGLQINNIAQAMMELNAYKHEFYERNSTRFGIENIIGNSPYMVELKKKILMVADSPSAIMLTGESGTGKEIFAKAIHFHSNRSNYPFVKVNCAAIPENLLESELFGYAEGAFTGARKGGKIGKFELANKGIIFLDEIGDMPLAMQAKLLRVLQEKEIERLGGEQAIPIDVRIISATHKDLNSMILQGTFRADLFYRLNVINFHIPALKNRKDDIPNLLDYFINDLNKKLNRNVKTVSPETMDRFMNYDWPGNIRELINVLEASMNFCHSDILGLKELPHFFVSGYLGKAPEEDLQATMEHVKKSEIVAALEKSEGKRKDAASILRISKSTLYRLMKKYDLIDKM